jgi:hypothetical protein
MTSPPESDENAAKARYGFFAVQARADAISCRDGEVTGVIENLTTGEKWRFESTTKLGELLTAWSRSMNPDQH